MMHKNFKREILYANRFNVKQKLRCPHPKGPEKTTVARRTLPQQKIFLLKTPKYSLHRD